MAVILIIDDDHQFRKMLRKTLEHDGYEVLEASNGLEGVNIFKEHHADLVITDIIMPEQEGIETIAQLRKDYPTLKIIAMSGGGLIKPENYLNIAKKLFSQRTFQKPFDRKDFLTAVRELTHEPDTCEIQ